LIYVVLFWHHNIFGHYQHIITPEANLETFLNYIPDHDSILQLLLFIVGIVVTGEAINSITSKIDKISPIKRNKNAVLNKFLKPLKNKDNLPDYHPIKKATWPIWLNITNFPVTFAHFDRYYVSILDHDKKTLAGKIDWLSFYRNMTAICTIILILQSYLLYQLNSASGNKIFNSYLWEIFVFTISLISIGLFYAGHHAQVNAHRMSLWDAFKRNELRKNFEIRYGEISLSMGIKDEYKNKFIEYFVDRWFLGVEQSVLYISSFVLTLVEEAYMILNVEITKPDSSFQSFVNSFDLKAKNSIKFYIQFKKYGKYNTYKLEKTESEVRGLLIDSYKEWNIGGYTQVLFNCLKLLDYFNLELKQEAWQTIRGQYNLENSLRTDAAFKEVEENVGKWGWTYDKKNEKSNNNDVKNKKKEFDEVANIVSKSTNPYFYNFDIIMSALKELQRIHSGSLDNFDKIDIWVENEKGKHKELKVSVDGRISTILIDNDIFILDDKDKLLKVRMNGTLSSINIDKNVLEIDIQNRLSNIYCLFGSNRYEKQDLKLNA